MPGLDGARQHLRDLEQMLKDDFGLSCAQLPEHHAGVGVAVAFDRHEYALLTCPGYGNEGQLYVTAGVYRDVARDETTVLRACNARTQSNAAYPYFLHDAESGWDVILQQSYPMQLVTDVPPFLEACMRGVAEAAAEARPWFAARGVSGQPYAYDDADVSRLLLRSLI